jgi:hypothetical protein
MYLDGVLVWKTVRAPNTRIPSGGTLVVGREQDCKGADGIVSRASSEQTFFCHLVLRTLLIHMAGGCFDSKSTAAGTVDTSTEYGSQVRHKAGSA